MDYVSCILEQNDVHNPRPEFPLVKEVWYHYHQQEPNPDEDRIFGTYFDGNLAAFARCRLHPDGHEVDGVFTLDEYPGRGLARLVVQALIDAWGTRCCTCT